MQLTISHCSAPRAGGRPWIATSASRFVASAGATMSALWSAVLALFGVYRH